MLAPSALIFRLYTLLGASHGEKCAFHCVSIQLYNEVSLQEEGIQDSIYKGILKEKKNVIDIVFPPLAYC